MYTATEIMEILGDVTTSFMCEMLFQKGYAILKQEA
jgi:hypothetical protein